LSSISNLGYVVIGSRKIAEWRDFAVDILGLQVGRHEPGKLLALRMDEMQQRIVIEDGDEEDLRAAGWMFQTAHGLQAYVQRLREAGLAVQECSPEQAANRRVEKLYCCQDPNGYALEFYCGGYVAPSNQPFKSALLRGPGFRTGDLGIGHVLVRAKDYAQSMDFYQNHLGLRLSDIIRGEVRPGYVAEAAFFHTAGGRHHSLATGAVNIPKVLGHLMVELYSLDDVGMAYDRCRLAGLHFARELGHHPNDQMTSFYVETPSGFSMECGWGGLVVEDDNWTVKTYNQFSDWGHARPGQAAR
jgi:2,3-dihydroxybiphenyl 1,2-dioxygenase